MKCLSVFSVGTASYVLYQPLSFQTQIGTTGTWNSFMTAVCWDCKSVPLLLLHFFIYSLVCMCLFEHTHEHTHLYARVCACTCATVLVC